MNDPIRNTLRSTAVLLASLTLAACANLSPPAGERARPELQAPEAWRAPLPHNGALGELAQWWAQFQDPLLSQLVAGAQEASPTVASARSRITQARATLAGTQAALGPTLNAVAGASRGQQDVNMPVATSLSAGLQAQWEIDVFGGATANRDAAQERLGGAAAAWHDARVAVAAEVATQYTSLRACEAQVLQSRADARSRVDTARLTALAAQAGFQAPASAELLAAPDSTIPSTWPVPNFSGSLEKRLLMP